MFKGIYTALLTPFTDEGKIDFPALECLIEKQISAGIDGLVLLGTTAETATLQAQEKQALLQAAVQQINHRVKIIIGTGTNCTSSTLQNTEEALSFQPDGILVVTPYYNKPNPSGLLAHYQKIAHFGAPIVLYHIPGRTGLKLPVSLIGRLLQEVPQIKAVKESDYDICSVTDTALRFGKKINYLCGNDDLFLQYLSIGCSGIISAAANVMAPAFVAINKAWQAGQPQQALEIFSRAYPLIKACYLETNPTCVKYLLSRMHITTPAVRLPLGAVSESNQNQLDHLLTQTETDLLI